jgi:hypothetical protein
MRDDLVSHVQIAFSNKTKHYYCIMKNKEEETIITLDIGTDPEDVKRVVELLKEEYGGVALPPGWRNEWLLKRKKLKNLGSLGPNVIFIKPKMMCMEITNGIEVIVRNA